MMFQLAKICYIREWIYYNSIMSVKKVEQSQEKRASSPTISASMLKEDNQDRLATRNSLQITAEERLQVRRNKRTKIQIVQRSHHTKNHHHSTQTFEEADQTKIILPDGLDSNQRLILKNQSTNIITEGGVELLENKTKRNKIFSQSYMPKRHLDNPLQKDGENNDLMISSTKRLSNKIKSIFDRQQAEQIKVDESEKHKKRFILHEISLNPPQEYPTVVKNTSQDQNNQSPPITKLILSYPKFTPNVKQANIDSLTPAITHSRILRPSFDHTKRFVMDEAQCHTNPAAKKIKHPKLRQQRKTTKCSFSKITHQKQLGNRIYFAGDSRSSNCLLPECLIKDNLANYNIKVVQSCSSSEEDGERYFDTEASPIRQKISYRNIEIQHAHQDYIAQEEIERRHNLFLDFQFPSTPKRQHERNESKENILPIPKSNKKLIMPIISPKISLHSLLICLAILLLIVQILG